jgi:hypothetical protein
MLDAGANFLLSTFVLSDVAKTLAPEYKQVPMAVASFGEMMQLNLSSITVDIDLGEIHAIVCTDGTGPA